MVAAVSSDQPEIDLCSRNVDRLVRLFQGEIVVLGGSFDVSAAIAELRLRGFGGAVGQKEATGFRLTVEPEFVRECFGEATLKVNGKEVKVSRASLVLLHQSEVTWAETPALDELISLLRLERVVPRDVSELREAARRVGIEWAIDFGSTRSVPVSDPDSAELLDFAIGLQWVTLSWPICSSSRLLSVRDVRWRNFRIRRCSGRAIGRA
jgi:hypothetical protein